MITGNAFSQEAFAALDGVSLPLVIAPLSAWDREYLDTVNHTVAYPETGPVVIATWPKSCPFPKIATRTRGYLVDTHEFDALRLWGSECTVVIPTAVLPRKLQLGLRLEPLPDVWCYGRGRWRDPATGEVLVEHVALYKIPPHGPLGPLIGATLRAGEKAVFWYRG